jgi:hypothetical protein
MTGYLRKPNTFDELLVETTTDGQDVATFFGQSYDTNRFSFQGAGFVGNGSFVVILGI